MEIQQVGLLETDREPVVQGKLIPFDVHCIQSDGEKLWIDPHAQGNEAAPECGNDRVFYTHMPWGREVNPRFGELLLGQDDLRVMRSVKDLRSCFLREGYPKDEPFPMNDPAHKNVKVRAVCNGDSLSVGECEIRCIHTPGPTPGHTCLYLPQEQTLFAGALLSQPSKMSWVGHEPQALENLLKSLEEIKELPAKRVFPAWEEDTSLKDRAEQISRTCYFRVLELLRLVQDHPGLTAYELASRFSRMEKAWSELSSQRRLEAMEGTMAYLSYLRDRDYIRAVTEDGVRLNVPGKRRLTDVV